MIRRWSERTEQLVKSKKMRELRAANVLVVGLGGVGAYAAEMIARAGVEQMTIVDADKIAISNINRQLIALHSTVGQSKAEVLAFRLLDINPKLQLVVIEKYIKDEQTAELFEKCEPFDFVVDAIDTLSPKVNLILECLKRKIPLVSSMGAGAKFDPTRIEVADIGKTHHCPLAHMLRKRLHKNGVHSGFWAVFSAEEPRRESIEICEEENKKSSVGTISYMPAAFGCAAASVAIRSILGEL